MAFLGKPVQEEELRVDWKQEQSERFSEQPHLKETEALSMGKVKVAVIGCGTIANNAHIPAYQKNPDVEITFFSSFPALRNAMAISA